MSFDNCSEILCYIIILYTNNDFIRKGYITFGSEEKSSGRTMQGEIIFVNQDDA